MKDQETLEEYKREEIAGRKGRRSMRRWTRLLLISSITSTRLVLTSRKHEVVAAIVLKPLGATPTQQEQYAIARAAVQAEADAATELLRILWSVLNRGVCYV
jgi:hypothetical protein